MITKYISGGFADVQEGYYQHNEEMKQNCVFKISINIDEKSFQEEVESMKFFENPINTVKIIKSVQINEFYIQKMEQFKNNQDEINEFKNRQKEFSFDTLLRIVFDLLDLIIQLRMYNIIHLDIKSANIQKKQDDLYEYSDFGCSTKFILNKKIKRKGHTHKYAYHEQKQKVKILILNSDVFCLGKTLRDFLILLLLQVMLVYAINILMIQNILKYSLDSLENNSDISDLLKILVYVINIQANIKILSNIKQNLFK